MLKFLSLALSFSVLANCLLAENQRPNIIAILTDDQGWGDLSFNGNRNLHTPNIDSIARNGAHFDRFYVQPVCSPTRAEFLTGRYHPRMNVFSTSEGGERFNLDETTIADVFKKAGYKTAAFGKWHSGMQYPYHPNGRGFEEFYGFCSGHWGDYYNPLLEHNGKIVKGEGFIIDDLTTKAIEYIQSNKDKPFFIYLPYNTPHSPMQVPKPFWDKFKDLELMKSGHKKDDDGTHTRAALAMCENIDWNVGRLLKSLRDTQLLDNTILLYFSDNGPNGQRWNGGMNGRKGSTSEGGVRSPLHIQWPAKISKGRQVKTIAASIDLLPTLADMAGIPSKTHKKLDGISLKNLLVAPTPKAPERKYIFTHWKKKTSVRSQQYRLDHQNKLFDMKADPGEKNDIKKQEPQIHKAMLKAKNNWEANVFAKDYLEDRPMVIGHKDFDQYTLPARDAKFIGELKRSNKFPNCSFIQNWVQKEDHIYFDIEVQDEGTFELDLYYTCKEGHEGSTFKVSFMDQSLEGTITEAFDPPLRGMENDWHPRMESYVKDFKKLPLGTFQLKKGKGQLKIELTSIPSDSAFDFRLLQLGRVQAQ